MKIEIESGSFNKSPKLLKVTEFIQWKERFKQFIKSQVTKMWVCIVDGYVPSIVEFEGRQQVKKYGNMTDDEKKMFEAEQKALDAITMVLP